jgi:hypothetical protein
MNDQSSLFTFLSMVNVSLVSFDDLSTLKAWSWPSVVAVKSIGGRLKRSSENAVYDSSRSASLGAVTSAGVEW